jgi:YVTN family beta-propeller protein
VSTSDPVRAEGEFAGYRLMEEIGRGGMGVVFRARDDVLDRSVAVKLVGAEFARDDGFRERFIVESRLAASLDHPNVVPVYGAGEVGGRLFLAMRYVQGRDLRQLLGEEAPLAPTRAFSICGQVADALDAAHERGLVHRDVKPSNVLLDEREHAYLADFGLTRRVHGDGLGPGRSVGTPAYVAPEQIEGKRLDGRADQYSLACVLYECLTGEPPFRRATVTATLYAHLDAEPPGHPGLEHVFAKALAKDPRGRYASCAEFVRAAQKALGLGEPVRPLRSRASLVVAAAGALLVAAGLGGILLATSGGSQPTTASSLAGDGRVTRIDPKSDETRSSLTFGRDLSDVASGAGSVWVASFGTGTLASIDPETGALDDVIAASAAETGPVGISVFRNRVWIVSTDGVRPYLADEGRFANAVEGAGSFRLESVYPIFDEVPVVADDRYVWTLGDGDTVIRHTIAGGTAAVVSLGTRAGAALALALGDGAVWATTNLPEPQLVKLDRDTHRVTGRVRLPSGAVPTSLAEGSGALWVASSVSDEVLRVEIRLRGDSTLSHFEEPRVVARITVGKGPTDIAVGAGSVWVANYLDGTVSKIDPATNSVVDTIAVGGWPEHIAARQGGVWVAHDPPEEAETT